LRRTAYVSILALALASATAAQGGDWFRLGFAYGPPPIVGTPPDGSVAGSIEFVIDGAIRTEATISVRAGRNLSTSVLVNGVDGAQTVSAIDLPAGATWSGNGIAWPLTSAGTYHPKIEVRDAANALVARAQIELVVHPELSASVSKAAYDVEVGEDLTILPTLDNLVGVVQWGATPSELPEWLSFEATTGAITVDTAAPNTVPEIMLTAVDQFDLAVASTQAFAISVNAPPSDGWIATLTGNSAEWAQSVAVGADGSLYLTGRTTSSTSNNGNYDVLLAKYSATGELQWHRTLGGTKNDYGNAVAVGADGSCLAGPYALNRTDVVRTASATYSRQDIVQPVLRHFRQGDGLHQVVLGWDGAVALSLMLPPLQIPRRSCPAQRLGLGEDETAPEGTWALGENERLQSLPAEEDGAREETLRCLHPRRRRPESPARAQMLCHCCQKCVPHGILDKHGLSRQPRSAR